MVEVTLCDDQLERLELRWAQHHMGLQNNPGRILIHQIENVENREAAWGAAAFLLFVPLATLVVVLLSKVMGW